MVVRVRDLTPRHVVTVRCWACDRTVRLAPIPTAHLTQPEARVLSLGFRCGACRRAAVPLSIELDGLELDYNEALTPPDAWTRPKHRLTTRAETDLSLAGRPRR